MANPNWHKGMPSANPDGRPPGPTAPTLLLKDAFLRAARTAGGGGENGLHDYLVKVALSHPQVFVPALSKIIPFEVSMRGNGNITINIVKDPGDEPGTSRTEMKVINGEKHNGTGLSDEAARLDVRLSKTNGHSNGDDGAGA